MITHYVANTGIDYLFISRWWLQINEQAMTTRPYQPRDTRLTVYSMRNYIHLHPSTIDDWRAYRDAALDLEEHEAAFFDVGLSKPAADIQLLNAVRKTPVRAIPFQRRADLVALPNFLWRRKTRCLRKRWRRLPYWRLWLAVNDLKSIVRSLLAA